SHQQVDFARMKLIEHALKVVAAAHGIAIQAPDPRPWKRPVQPLFHLFRSCAEKGDVFTVASWTAVGDSLLVAALMDLNLVCRLVSGQRDPAVSALPGLAAGPAKPNR